MQIKEVNDSKEDHERIQNLYLEAFPADERIPYWALKRRTNQGKADMWNLWDGETWIGWTYVIKYTSKANKKLAYVFYFAIDAPHRGKGYGTQALKGIFEKYHEYIISLAIEVWEDEQAENHEQRIRRHNFYKNCGMEDLPYRTKGNQVTFDLMCYGGYLEPEEYKEMMEDYTGWPFKYFFRIAITEK